MKLVETDDWAIMQVFGALLNDARVRSLADRSFFANAGRRFFEVQARQPEPLAAAVPVVPSKGNERAASGDARRREPRPLRRLSRERVRRLGPPDLHDLSYERTGGNGEAFPAAFEFWNAFRSCAPPKNKLRELS